MQAEGEEAAPAWVGAQAASAVSKQIKTVFPVEKIAAVLPHRYPFALVDKVIEFEPGKRAVGIKQASTYTRFHMSKSRSYERLMLHRLPGATVVGTDHQQRAAVHGPLPRAPHHARRADDRGHGPARRHRLPAGAGERRQGPLLLRG